MVNRKIFDLISSYFFLIQESNKGAMPKMNPCWLRSGCCFQVFCLFFNLLFVKNLPSKDNDLIIVNHLIQGRNKMAGIRGEPQSCGHHGRESNAPTNSAMSSIFDVFCIFQ